MMSRTPVLIQGRGRPTSRLRTATTWTPVVLIDNSVRLGGRSMVARQEREEEPGGGTRATDCCVWADFEGA